MNRNVGTGDRWARALAGSGMLFCSVMAPLPLPVRLALMAVPGAYFMFSALAGWCIGYRLTGRSTCRALPRP